MSASQATEKSYRRRPEGAQKPQPVRAQSECREPFKILTAEKIRRLCYDLKPAALKVWLYHLSRSGPDDTSYPKLETIASETNQNIETVKIARKWLRENGWLVTEGHRWIGPFSVPVERCAFPPAQGLVFPPVEKLPQTEKPAMVIPPTEVDSKNLEVGDADSPVQVLEIVKGERGESSSPLTAEQKPDDDSALHPDFDSIERKIQQHIYEAKRLLLQRGYVEHLVDAALHYIEERCDYSGTVTSSPNYFITAFHNALADPRDCKEITRRAANRARLNMPTGREQVATDEISKKIEFVHAAVEDADRLGRRASKVAAERLAAAGGRA